MTMKKLATSLYIAAAVLLLPACSKQLNTAPSDAVTGDQLYGTVNALGTIYEGTWASMMDSYWGDIFGNPGFKTIGLVSDAMGDDAALIPNKYGYRDAYPFTEINDKTKSRVAAIWTTVYKVINNMNIILAHADAAQGDEGSRNALKGQAMALRADMYLTLASFYQFSYLKDSTAKAVPIYTQPASDTTQGRPRATLKEIYTQVFADLTQAETLLQGYSRPSKYKIDVNVVNGLLARAYLNTGRWAQAATAAVKARDGYTFMSASDYAKGFNDINNSEWIWGEPETTVQRTGSDAFHFLDVTNDGSYYYSFMADPFFMQLFDDGDYRKALFSWDADAGREGYLQYKKFLFRGDLTADLVLMRSAEEYLIEAEGNARAGNTGAAVTALNALKTARNAKAYDPAGKTQQDLIDAILIERRKELFGEGFALADIIRNQLSVVRKPYVDGQGRDIQVTIVQDGVSKQVPARYHTVRNFPDKSAFVANSPYYIFSVPLVEEQNNPNLDK